VVQPIRPLITKCRGNLRERIVASASTRPEARRSSVRTARIRPVRHSLPRARAARRRRARWSTASSMSSWLYGSSERRGRDEEAVRQFARRAAGDRYEQLDAVIEQHRPLLQRQLVTHPGGVSERQRQRVCAAPPARRYPFSDAGSASVPDSEIRPEAFRKTSHAPDVPQHAQNVGCSASSI
jgi:hypothetical protein